MSCSAVYCKSRSASNGVKTPGLSFHTFPKCPDINQKWIQAVKRENWTPNKYSRLCSKHFEKACFLEGLSIRKLRSDAIPTIFEEYPTYFQKIPKARKRLLVNRSIEVATPNKTKKLEDSNTNVADNLTPRKKKLSSDLSKARQLASRRLRLLKKIRESKRRLTKKNAKLLNVIEELKKKQLIENESLDLLNSIGEKNKDLLIRLTSKHTGKPLSRKYSPDLRKFALTLHFLSPRAYKFVRAHFDTCLPHAKTISKWYQCLDCEPGFTKESFDILKLKSNFSDKPLVCALSMDEMAIRKCVEWDGKRAHGYVNVGNNLEGDNVPLATEALTFMLTCVNGSWKIPVGFFFINGVTGLQKAQLVRSCLDLLTECNVTVLSLTFDGAPNNISMASHLGCNLDVNNLKTYFIHDDNEVCILLDPCHCLKLVRNTFGDKRRIFNKEDQLISWHYVELLHETQTNEQLHAANKLRHAHINYHKQKMKVKLASQLLSKSVADALTCCRTIMNLPDFRDCKATCAFIEKFNDVFDLLNSRNLRAYGFKQAILPRNIETVNEIIFESVKYIKGLRFEDGTLLVQSPRKVGFLGFIVCLNSVKRICEKYLLAEPPKLSFLCTYKLSQDHIELFFGAIRAKGGFNNNPSAKQYISAYKRLLVHAEFQSSENGNCVPLEEITILNCTKKIANFEEIINKSLSKYRMLEILDMPDNKLNSQYTDHDYVMDLSHLSEYTDHIIYYISGFVVRKVIKAINCENCIQALVGHKKDSLTSVKDKGGLVYPSDDVFFICKMCEKVLRRGLVTFSDVNREKEVFKMITDVILMFLHSDRYDATFTCLNEHLLEFSLFEDHKYLLIKLICEKYFNLRIHYIAKNMVVENSVRVFYNKMVLFKGQ